MLYLTQGTVSRVRQMVKTIVIILGILLIIALVLVILLMIDCVTTRHFHTYMLKTTTGPSYNLGNKMSSLFGQEMFLQSKQLNFPDYKLPRDGILAKLVQTFTPLKDNSIFLPITTSKMSWELAGLWEANHVSWAAAQPLIQRRINACIDHVDDVQHYDLVVHLRCGDIPFNRNRLYHLVHAQAITDTIDDIGDVSNVLIVTGTRKKDERRQICCGYVEAIKQILVDRNIHVDLQSESADVDFATLVCAKRLLFGHSSFAFFAGLACQGEVFAIGAGFLEKHVPLHERWHWLNNKDYIVQHDNVIDYFDIQEVIEKSTVLSTDSD
jgi:hypothetical protein